MSQQLVPANQSSSLAPANAGQALSLQDKLRYCEWLSKADMLPANYAGKPGNVLVAMELGETLGLAPVVTILELYVVNNRPSISAKLMAALTRRAGHSLRTVSDDKQATCTITRRDTQEQTVLTFTMADAEKAGLASKDMWKKYPKRMLENRAISACVRLACPEVTMAVSQTPDELGDDGRVETVTAEFVPERVVERPAEEPGTAKSYGNIKVSEAQPAPERKARANKKAAEEQQAPPAAPPAEEQAEQPKSDAHAAFDASLPENDPKPASVQQINDAWEAWKKAEGFDPETGEHIPGRDKQRLEEVTGITSLRSLTVGQVERMNNHLAAMAASF